MATIQEETNHSLSNSVLKSKNVAKKSTTKLSHSRSSSRSGSPCSVPPSLSHSREASPEVQASILNGKLKGYVSSQGVSSQDDCKVQRSGPSLLVQHSMDGIDDGPANNAQVGDDQAKSSVIKFVVKNQTSSNDQGSSGTSVACSNGNASEGNVDGLQTAQEKSSKTVCDPEMMKLDLGTGSNSSTAIAGMDAHTTSQSEKDAACCAMMSKSNFIQAKDALRERLKAAVYKFSSDKVLMSGSDKNSDGERSPTLASKPDQSMTPNRCSSPVTPRSGMIDKGNLFEIMTLNLGKPSLDAVTSAAGNEEQKSVSSSVTEKPAKCLPDSVTNTEDTYLSEGTGSLSALDPESNDSNVLDQEDNKEKSKQPSEVTVDGVHSRTVDQTKSQKDTSQPRQVRDVGNDDNEVELMLLGVSDSNENFDTLDDSILDEEPKRALKENCDSKSVVSRDQNATDTAGCSKMPRDGVGAGGPLVSKSEDLKSDVKEGVKRRRSGSGDADSSMVIDDGDTVDADHDISDRAVEQSAGDSNKRKLSHDSPGELLVKRGRIEGTGNVTDGASDENLNHNVKEESRGNDGRDKEGSVGPDVNSGMKADVNSDIKLDVDRDVKPDVSSDAKQAVDGDDVKRSVIQCNGDKDDSLHHDDDDDDDDVISTTTVGDPSIDHENNSPAVKTESDGVVRISRESLENLIAKALKERLASLDSVKRIADLQGRVDKLTEQLYRCKATAKSYQLKLADITKSGRSERKRTLRGPVRHVAVQVDILKQQASHLPAGQKSSPRGQTAGPQTAGSQAAASQTAGPHAGSPSTATVAQASAGPQVATFVSQPPPTIAPKVSGIGQAPIVSGGSQTFLVPVAGASANGTMTLIGPPGGTNLATSQYRFTAVQAPAKPTGVTVREMLDSKQTGGASVLPVTQVNLTSSTSQSEGGLPEKVIDLTEDEESSTNKAPLTPITLAPGQVIVQSSLTSTSNGTIPTGTYLVPVTSGQPIILQSVVQQQLQQPVLLSSARPTVSQQQHQIAPAPAPAGQQLVNLVPAQPGVRPLLVQTSATKAVVTTSVVTKSIPAAHTTTAKPVGSKLVKHPAPLPPQPTTSKIGAEYKTPPPKPKLTISRVPQGIVLSWNLSLTENHAAISNYQLYAYQEGTSPPVSSLWKRVGDVKALPLPMACTLTQFHEGNKYHFAVRGVDEHGRVGPFSDPNSIHLDTTSTS